MTKARSRLAINMMFSGIGLGAVAGFFVSMSVLIAMANFSLSYIPGFLIISVIVGGSFGAMFGGVSGAFSGMAMMMVTALFFNEIRYPSLFRYMMGIITFIMTGLVFMVGEFSAIDVTDHNTWVLVTLLSVLIAVAASQRATNRYQREIDIRKAKEK